MYNNAPDGPWCTYRLGQKQGSDQGFSFAHQVLNNGSQNMTLFLVLKAVEVLIVGSAEFLTAKSPQVDLIMGSLHQNSRIPGFTVGCG